MRATIVALLALCAGCRNQPAPDAPTWVRVMRDANYEVAVDTSRTGSIMMGVLHYQAVASEVWYRTDHAQPRLHNGKEFTREIVHSVVTCDSLLFKVLAVDMWARNGKRIAIQRLDLNDQEWRRVERGASEEVAAEAACHFAKRRAAARGSRQASTP